MLVRRAQARDGTPLRYYTFGSGPTPLVILNAPGMGVRFWARIAAALEDQFTITVPEYRGYLPESDAPLAPDAAGFARAVDDVLSVIDVEGIRAAEFACWCAGTSLALSLHGQRPDLVQGLVAYGVGDGREDTVAQFDEAIRDILGVLESDTRSAPRLFRMMSSLGLYRDDDYFESLAPNPLLGDVAQLPPYMLYDTPARLQTYCRSYRDFGANFVPARRRPHPPLLLLNSTSQLASDQEQVEEDGIQSCRLRAESAFALVEKPAAIARAISGHAAARQKPLVSHSNV